MACRGEQPLTRRPRRILAASRCDGQITDVASTTTVLSEPQGRNQTAPDTYVRHGRWLAERASNERLCRLVRTRDMPCGLKVLLGTSCERNETSGWIYLFYSLNNVACTNLCYVLSVVSHPVHKISQLNPLLVWAQLNAYIPMRIGLLPWAKAGLVQFSLSYIGLANSNA